MTKLLLCILLLISFFALCHGLSHEDELRSELMKDYNKDALPKRLVKLSLGFTVVQFDMDERRQRMEADMWVHMNWHDPRLQWNYGKHSSIKVLAFPAKSLWTPDITLYNHGDIKSAIPYLHTQIHVTSAGNMTWVPPAHVKASCVLDMTYWPYDVHNCTMKFGSWVHSSESIFLVARKQKVDMQEFSFVKQKSITRSEWYIEKTGIVKESKVYTCCPEDYHSVSAWFILRREAPAFRWLVHAPIIVLSMFTFIIFLLPVASGEKIILGGIVLILDLLLLLEISNLIGHAPNHTPLIMKFLCKQFVLTGVTLMISVIIIRMTRNSNGEGVPPFFRKIINITSKYLFIKNNDIADSKDQEAKMDPGSEKDEWVILASIIDRFCFVLFVLIFFLNVICYSSVL